MVRRALHFVFKVGDRKTTIKFFKDVLGMRVLRHEEFEDGCRAECNGPYDLNWSKTMIGYGPEVNHFVMELTYNYGIGSYAKGNDFVAVVIRSDDVLKNAQRHAWPVEKFEGHDALIAPGGYRFVIKPRDDVDRRDPVEEVVLASSDLARTVSYWQGLLGMKMLERSDREAAFAYDDAQCRLRFRLSAAPIDRAKAYGRVAFECPAAELPDIEQRALAGGHQVLKPLTRLDTPGKATVTVVILADPDGHEICFVDAESFRLLSAVDPEADRLLREAIDADKSAEWYRDIQGGDKPAA
ncbi:glyoxalase domain-containing protein 4-like [Amblyomma americanum]|uniref:VOC domain-containing protein n=1 Tax=Amblyomma americanum TaxID=6943 RepID=A0AAQ4E992_AMBAM